MPTIYGLTVDEETRCEHYHQTEDVIAIKFKCCSKYYPCYKCHQACADHSMKRWGKHEFDQYAILCGVCKTELTIYQYLNSNKCPACAAPFNPGCANHYHLYFDL
ncbi:CHY zinc finger protein [Gracilibacillus alcaliphilus]|uniref:CHY zinc finger protein n=1 Tax=Gracilibacillus alcaliphilus TaxID=1401441 RepID=UPI00195B86CB|nr:CHY zinc finger protein [Gracilibacillus alcaliphilus]MBM7675956.1 putative CHY-type Zn-finger protein [Gracilibacillus alcaliphilus]